MAQILSFRTPESKTGTALRKGCPAEVIVFPGVRYERWSDGEETSSAAGDQRRAHRDVLELAE
jgi:hypothetical protein